MVRLIGLISAVILPLWNIPLIYRILVRKSSKDISIFWALGVWLCIIGMMPAAFYSEDFIWRVFNIGNLVLFTGVVIVVLRYRRQ
ncbi:MAG: hypothetical protein ABIH01_01020 [Candidatus Omnitrophota bacterium]